MRKYLRKTVVKGAITENQFTEWKSNFPSRAFKTESEFRELADNLRDAGILGDRTRGDHVRHLVNLIGMFYLDEVEPRYVGRQQQFNVTATGVRRINPGNPSGGTWDGIYRYFCIQDNAGRTRIVSFAVIRSEIEQTMFIVAVDRDGQDPHNSLQLDLDKFVMYDGDTMEIWHNGTLTQGDKGSAKRDAVVEFVCNKTPHLVREDRIMLGSLPLNRLITWKDAEEFIYNCIEYALVRDEFRKEAKTE